jgi:2-dehydro-3-deoxyphosphooctonate aldolase (KDO 8-P synthase)
MILSKGETPMLDINNFNNSLSHSISEARVILIAGPCSMESEALVEDVCGELSQISKDLDVDLVFKSSFDKANRSSRNSYRSLGIERGMELLAHLRKTYGVPVSTDIHETWQVPVVAEVADILQIPAFLCRQSDLLVAAGKSGKVVNIKKGQFLSPEEMPHAIDKVRLSEDQIVISTERGSSFGYNNLIVDFRSLPIMRNYGPVFFDVTHSTQRPGALNGSSGGDRRWAPYLARAAAAVGVDGYFIETHPDPDKALSDGPLMIRLSRMRELIQQIKDIHQLRTSFTEIL